MKKKLGLGFTLTQLVILWFASPAFARSIDLKGAGTALWIFIILGAAIILLQLIPAVILFISMIGTSTHLALGEKKEKEVAAIAGITEKA